MQVVHPFFFFVICMVCLNSCELRKALKEEMTPGTIYAVGHDISFHNLGLTLSHEHIMSNFGGEPSYDPNYDRMQLFQQVIPYLKKLKALGVSTIFDCTTAYFGRDVKLLRELSDSTGIQIVSNTGFYGAANDRYIPAMAYEKSISDIAAVWIDEFQKGIDGSGIKPGFIKLAFDNGTPSAIDLKLFEAGIQAHLATGLTLAVHTGNNPEAVQKQMELLEKYQVAFSNWIWVHANKSPDDKILLDAAKRGAWISLDGCKSEHIPAYISRLQKFKRNNLLGNILLSHDGNSFPRGKAVRPYHTIPEELIEKLSEEGFTAEEINLLLVKNPWQAFAVVSK